MKSQMQIYTYSPMQYFNKNLLKQRLDTGTYLLYHNTLFSLIAEIWLNAFHSMFENEMTQVDVVVVFPMEVKATSNSRYLD